VQLLHLGALRLENDRGKQDNRASEEYPAGVARERVEALDALHRGAAHGADCIPHWLREHLG